MKLAVTVVLPVLSRGVEVSRIKTAPAYTIFHSFYLLTFKILEGYKQPNIHTAFLLKNLLMTRFQRNGYMDLSTFLI